MALSANTVWEVRPTNGSDTNGGGFVAGSTGTDWSQQNAAQYAVTDGVLNGTTTVTSATANFGADVVGNIAAIAGAWYQIMSRTNATTIVVDRATGTASGQTINIGGALQTIPAALAVWVVSNKIFVKAEATITTAATITISGPNNNNQGANSPPNRLIGYASTRTDGGQATIRLSTNSGLACLSYSGISGHSLENFNLDCNSLGTSTGLVFGCSFSRLRNVKIQNFTTAGITISQAHNQLFGLEATGGTAAATAAVNITSGTNSIQFGYIHDNACPGILITVSGISLDHLLIANNTGAASDGIRSSINGGLTCIAFCTVFGSGRDGFRGTTVFIDESCWIKNNIFANNAGFGLNYASSAGTPAFFHIDGNAYYNNTSGARNNCDDTTTNPINGVAPYTNVFDVLVTDGSPFTNAAGGDFTLNGTALRGALIRGHGTPGPIPGVSQIGYEDFGVFQHQDSGGGGTTSIITSPRRIYPPQRQSPTRNRVFPIQLQVPIIMPIRQRPYAVCVPVRRNMPSMALFARPTIIRTPPRQITRQTYVRRNAGNALFSAVTNNVTTTVLVSSPRKVR